MLKALISGGHYDPKAKKITPVSPPLNFADRLYPIIKPHILAWATGPSSFVVLSLLETESFSGGSRIELLGLLREGRHELEKAAREETAEQRAAREEKGSMGEEEIAAKGKAKGKGKGKAKKRSERETPVGNKGTKMILQMLDSEK
jgi:pumilio family protein 6